MTNIEIVLKAVSKYSTGFLNQMLAAAISNNHVEMQEVIKNELSKR